MAKEKPRLLIIGSRGFLGGYIKPNATDLHVLEGNRIPEQDGEVEIDVTNEHSVKTAFRKAQPDLVFLFSAISDIDRCQQFPKEARVVNVRGAEHVVEACDQNNARLLFTSSAAVFDGTKHGYREEDPVTPVSVYGKTKAMAEKYILSLGHSAVAVRIALILGFAARPQTNAFMDSLKRRWSTGETVSLPTFEQRNPIDACTAARLMLQLLGNPMISGIFHLGCQEPITRYELGLKLASRMGYEGKVNPQREPQPGRAPRGADHFLLTDKLRTTCSVEIPSCEQVIERSFDGIA